MMEQSELIVYQASSNQTFEVRLESDTVWLTQNQMAELFEATKQNISLHISNIFKENELEEDATVKESLMVQKEGGRKQGYWKINGNQSHLQRFRLS